MLLKSCYQLRARNLTKKLTDQFHRDIIGRGGWNNNNLGGERLFPWNGSSDWLAGCLLCLRCTTEMRGRRMREREKRRGSEKDQKTVGETKDGVEWKETRAEEGIQFHCDENE